MVVCCCSETLGAQYCVTRMCSLVPCAWQFYSVAHRYLSLHTNTTNLFWIDIP